MGNKSKTPNPGGWGTSQFLNMVYGKINMSALGKDNIYKAAKKGAGIVVFALIVNTVGKYTIKRRLLHVYDAAIAGKLFWNSRNGSGHGALPHEKWVSYHLT